jgi:WD40 repeat protein
MTRDIPTLVMCRPRYIPPQLPTIACLHAPKYAEHVAAARLVPTFIYSVESSLFACSHGEGSRSLRPHVNAISAVAMSDCGSLALSCDIMGDVHVQRCRGAGYHEYQTSRMLITACSFAPKVPHQFVVGTMSGTLALYATSRTEMQRVFCGHTAGIVTVLIHPNSEFVGSTSCDGTIRLWSISQGCCVRLFKAAGSVPTSLRFSHSGKWIMTTATDGAVSVVDPGTGKIAKAFKASETVIMSADFSLNDELIIGYDRMGNFFIWETNEAYGAQLGAVRIDRVRVVAFDCMPNDEIRIVGCSKQ